METTDNSGQMYRTEYDIIRLIMKMNANTSDVVTKWKEPTRCYCSSCREWKDAEEFARDASRPNKHSNTCKECKRLYFQTKGKEAQQERVRRSRAES